MNCFRLFKMFAAPAVILGIASQRTCVTEATKIVTIRMEEVGPVYKSTLAKNRQRLNFEFRFESEPDIQIHPLFLIGFGRHFGIKIIVHGRCESLGNLCLPGGGGEKFFVGFTGEITELQQN